MVGQLGLISLSQLRTISADDYQYKLLIVREPGRVECSKYGFIHTPHLSPSPVLFKDYQTRWKYNQFTLKERDLLNATPNGTWWDLYVPRFSLEMKDRSDMRRALARVESLLDQGANVLFICFCKEETHCHRHLLGNYFEEKGYNVRHY